MVSEAREYSQPIDLVNSSIRRLNPVRPQDAADRHLHLVPTQPVLRDSHIAPYVKLEPILLPDAKRAFTSAGDKSFRNEFVRTLGKVQRMKLLEEIGLMLPGVRRQYNDEHTYDICADALRINNTTKELPKWIDFARVQLGAIVHDIGESNDAVSDVQPYNRTKKDEAKKRLEPWAGRMVIYKIPNPKVRELALGVYREHIEDDPRNLNVQMTRYLDKRDGTITYAEAIFNLNEVADPEVAKKMTNHLWHTVGEFMKPVHNLMRNLPTPEAKKEMAELVKTDLLKLQDLGHTVVIDSNMSMIDDYLKEYAAK